MGVVGPLGLGAVGIRRLIDAVTLGLAVATFARLGDIEVVLLALWVIVGIGALVYGFRAAIIRILIVALAVLAYAVVASSIGHSLDQDLNEFSDLTEFPMMIAIAVVVAFLADRIATSAGRYATLYREASERLLTAQEQERGRLARDLHDGVGQTLTAVILTLDAAEAELRADPNPSSALARSTIARAQVLAAGALEEARDVAAQLRPTRIHEIGLGAALVNLARDAGVAVEVRFDPALLPPGMLERETEVDTFRIVQEAIGNAARHSQATRIWIDGELRDDEIRLEVGDDGRGIDSSAWTRGLGLAGMEERAGILRARLKVRSRPGEGTIVTLSMPLPDARGDDGRKAQATAGANQSV
jgi:signal transduction histidine kinase